jgi:hypothetical protein
VTTAPKNQTKSIDDRDAATRLLLEQLSGLPLTQMQGDPDGLIERASRPGFGNWLHHAAKARGCTSPIRLRGEVLTVQASTGRVVERFNTDDLPDRVLYKPCGTRLPVLRRDLPLGHLPADQGRAGRRQGCAGNGGHPSGRVRHVDRSQLRRGAHPARQRSQQAMPATPGTAPPALMAGRCGATPSTQTATGGSDSRCAWTATTTSTTWCGTTW